MSNEINRMKEVREKINEVSPSFCLAKWKQVTIHLHNGHTHSCHHPATHKIPLEELEGNPSALHNTFYKKKQRKKMLEGTRPEECQYCWNVEDMDGDHVSDRVTKSADPQWSLPYFNEVKESEWDRNINPSYVEISFSNTCNFKCSYCGPVYSSQWVDEIKKHGEYNTSTSYNSLVPLERTKAMPIHHKEYNPYVEAFWEWWPSLVKDLKVFRMTGGEPLLEKNVFKTLERIIEDDHGIQEISVNTNGCVPDKQIDKFISLMREVSKKVPITRVYSSVDCAGSQAEYMRNGLDYEQWKVNMEKLLTELPDTKITIMATVNILSSYTYLDMLKQLLTWKKEFYNENRKVPVTLSSNMLRHPHHQRLDIAYPSWELYKHFEDCVDYMKQNQENSNGNKPYEGFFDFEIHGVGRIVEFIKEGCEKEGIDRDTALMDLKIFLTEHDNRRGTDYKKTFPDLAKKLEDFEKSYNNKIDISIK